ncbi:MAG TPA: sodium:solute symporter family protein, partial [Deltaproteobacteria bacterium]|nr:sodium:solute symporter family protein [Deltaproteobacteria bacterium]
MNFIIIGLFFTIMLAVGIISMKNVHTMAGYAVADRGAGAVVMTGSLLATVVGGSSTIGLAGLGYSLGLVGAWWLLVGAVGLAVLGTVFARRVRETGAYTLPEILERQYG